MEKRLYKDSSVGNDLSCFFEPQSVTVIASLREGWMGGYAMIKSLLKAGYHGKIFPVNPAYNEVHGLSVYPSVKDVRDNIDLSIIMINARNVAKTIEDCGTKGIRAAIIVSDGFAERDQEGARLQREIVRIARQQGMRIIGPNTVGIANSRNGLNPCPYDPGYYRLKEGPVAIFSQTGMTNPQAFPYPTLRFGISKICDLGNKCDLDECDMLEYLEHDPATGVISAYLESIRNGPRFLQVCKRVARKKPVLILKSGKTAEGAKASASHSGSLAVDDKIFDAACNQTGVLRIDSFDELFELPKIFTSQPLPKGPGLGIITQSGAFGVLAIDEGAKYGLTPAKLKTPTAAKLEGIFPGLGKNPVDIGPAAPAIKDFFSLYPFIVRSVMEDKNVDALLSILWAGSMDVGISGYIKAYEDLQDRYPKPVVTWVCGPSISIIDELTERLESLGFPVFSSLKTSIKAVGLSLRYAAIKGRL